MMNDDDRCAVPRCATSWLPRSAWQGLRCLSRNSWASHGHVRVAKLSETVDFSDFWNDWNFRLKTTFGNGYEQYGTMATVEGLSEQIWQVWHTHGSHSSSSLKYWNTTKTPSRLGLWTCIHIYSMWCNVLYCNDTMVMICGQKPKAYTFLLIAQVLKHRDLE